MSYIEQRRNLKLGLVTKPVKEHKPIAAESEKKKAEKKAAKPSKDLQNDWFNEIEEREFANGKCNCWNCGDEILRPFARTAIAHILPKRKNMFPSVATQPMNYLILGAGCGCHAEYDRTWEDASKMQVWPKAVERFLIFQSAIASDEFTRLPDILKEAANG